MPAIPELGQVGLGIRRGKVLREPDANQAGDTDGDIRVAAEVEIDLKRIGVDDNPHPACAADLSRQRIVQRDQCEGIGDHKLLEQPDEDALPREKRFILRERRILSQILREAFSPIDGTRGKRREKDNIGCKLWQ